MAEHSSDMFPCFSRGAAILFLMGVLLMGAVALPAGFVQALTRTELYQATAPLSERAEASQNSAFVAALKAVMIRVTGRRTADEDPALAPLYSTARRYVQQYRPTPDGQLWVSFDGAAIERWLIQSGLPLWGHERPSTFVWLVTAPGAVISAEDTSDLKAAVDAAALARGIPLVWPSAGDAQKYAASGSPAELGHRLGADGVLIGRAAALPSGAPPAAANVRWTLQYQDRSSDFTGVAEGVNRAADTYAALFAASGAVVPVDIEVSGVPDLKAYAGLETYLGTVTSISHVSVVGLIGDLVRFRLNTRGGAEALQHTLALGGRLLPSAAGDNGMLRFQLRR